MMSNLLHRIKRKWMKLRLQPIRVFCMHHVCKTFDAATMCEVDWMEIDAFRAKVLQMQRDGISFISLTEAYTKIATDRFRNRKYAVITFDDGNASLNEVLPWLEEQKIPVTLFINGKYLDGKSYRKNPNEKYLTKEELRAFTSPLIEIGSHGWEHIDARKLSVDEFITSVDRNDELLRSQPRFVPFYAYSYGGHTKEDDQYLKSKGLIPVLIDGQENIKDSRYIQRELL